MQQMLGLEEPFHVIYINSDVNDICVKICKKQPKQFWTYLKAFSSDTPQSINVRNRPKRLTKVAFICLVIAIFLWRHNSNGSIPKNSKSMLKPRKLCLCTVSTVLKTTIFVLHGKHAFRTHNIQMSHVTSWMILLVLKLFFNRS